METCHHILSRTVNHRPLPRFARHQDIPTLYALLKTPQKANPTKTTPQNDNEEQEERFYLCRQCSNPVAKIGDEVSIGDIPIETMQINPHGYIHEIFTIRSAFHVIIVGSPVPADSWFPGYMWRLCMCAECMLHLGWSYQNYNEAAIVFFGLRRGSVKEG